MNLSHGLHPVKELNAAGRPALEIGDTIFYVTDDSALLRGKVRDVPSEREIVVADVHEPHNTIHPAAVLAAYRNPR
ncbi:MAG TPA: hypothetical protein VFM97_00150 [Gammaproteobacteria bacterium]|nr:hypothetical protein [Gammaproteobacteria bacterium]